MRKMMNSKRKGFFLAFSDASYQVFQDVDPNFGFGKLLWSFFQDFPKQVELHPLSFDPWEEETPILWHSDNEFIFTEVTGDLVRCVYKVRKLSAPSSIVYL